MAEFRDLFFDFRSLGVQIAAVAVDSPEQSERVRQQYELPFPILCDTEKRLIRAWGLYNGKERGGIAITAVVLIERDRRCLRMTEGVATRVRAADLIKLLRSNPVLVDSADDVPAAKTTRQSIVFPRLIDFSRAIWNSLTRRN